MENKAHRTTLIISKLGTPKNIQNWLLIMGPKNKTGPKLMNVGLNQTRILELTVDPLPHDFPRYLATEIMKALHLNSANIITNHKISKATIEGNFYAIF